MKAKKQNETNLEVVDNADFSNESFEKWNSNQDLFDFDSNHREYGFNNLNIEYIDLDDELSKGPEKDEYWVDKEVKDYELSYIMLKRFKHKPPNRKDEMLLSLAIFLSVVHFY